MREHLGHPLSNGFALVAEHVELGAGALGIGEARAQSVDFLQKPIVFFCSLRLIGAQPLNDVHQKFDFVLESIDGIEIDSARDCLLCHPCRLTYRGEGSTAAQIVAQMESRQSRTGTSRRRPRWTAPCVSFSAAMIRSIAACTSTSVRVLSDDRNVKCSDRLTRPSGIPLPWYRSNSLMRASVAGAASRIVCLIASAVARASIRI